MPLSSSQQSRFRSAFMPLLAYVNQRLDVVQSLDEGGSVEDYRLRSALVARALWHHLDLIDDYVRENPHALDVEQLAVVLDLRNTIYDDMLYEGVQGGSAVFVHTTGAYRVAGHFDESIVELPNEPAMVRLALAPFESQIIAVMPIVRIGGAGEDGLARLRDGVASPDRPSPTASGEALAQRALDWQRCRNRRDRQDAERDARGSSLGSGFHRGALAGLSGLARKRAITARYDLAAHESGTHQQLMELRSVDATIFPMCLEEGLELLDDDWLASIAQHVCELETTPELPRAELIDSICQAVTQSRKLRDSALIWCEDTQFDLLRQLCHENPLSLNRIPPSRAATLYPMLPYVFILHERGSFVAWMPPEVRRFLREADLEGIALMRKQAGQAARAGDALASMCGIISMDDAFERYRDVADHPLDREHFEISLTEMETCESRDNYALWTHEGTTYLISAELSEQSALARIVRSCYSERIVQLPDAPTSHSTPTYFEYCEEDEETLRLLLDHELERLSAQRLALLACRRELPPHPLCRDMLETSYLEYLLETDSFLRIRDYVDEHLPDCEDDYEFATTFARAVIISSLFEGETYEEALDIIRLFGMRHCEGNSFPHRLGRLVTDAYNALPRWHLNGWSLAENTERLSGRKPVLQADISAPWTSEPSGTSAA